MHNVLIWVIMLCHLASLYEAFRRRLGEQLPVVTIISSLLTLIFFLNLLFSSGN